MSEVKLFGKMIQLASNDDVSEASVSEPNSDHNLSSSNASVSPKSLDRKNQSNAATDSASENPGTPSKDKEESESSISQEENPSKKPDKILPCPRCNSNETKFCYFNNYNLNQPRHFCKSCQRYWTAGGSVRNVPVGSGRRKTKNPLHPNSASSHCPETKQLPKKVCYDFSPKMINCYPAPPWYPAQWGPVSVVSTSPPPPFWSYGVASSSPLGKHSREGDLIKSLGCDKKESGETKTRVLVPKTLRIDDPSEAAKSSIWATLGIRNEKGDSIGSGGVFGGFRSKVGEMNMNSNWSSVAEGSLVLQANPAAFSRSLRFHESAE